MLRGGFCFPCNFKAENSYNCYQNAYSFNDSFDTNYISQPQYENYLCNLCGNNSHDGYDCQQQFSFVYEHEPSYNQNYDDNYYSHDLPSFPCCDYCGGSHENYQCQPDSQNVDFSGSDQIQNPQYPDIYPLNGEFEACTNANDDEDHSVQDKESPENSSEEIVVSNPDQEKEPEVTTDTELPSIEDIQPLPVQEPPRNSDIHQLIEECFVEFLCIHNDVDDLIESALDSKLLSINSINSQRLDKKEQEVKNVAEQQAERGNRSIQSLQNFRVVHKSSFKDTSQISSIHAVAPILSTKEPENSLSMGYEHLSITPKTESDEFAESNAENLLPIPSECEVALEDKRECTVPISENFPDCDNHSDILFDSNNDDLSSDDESFKDIEYVDVLVPDPAIVSIEEENVVQQEEEEVDFEDISHVQDVVLREKLFRITRLISNIEYLNENSTPDRVLNSFESDNSLLDNFSPEFETFCDNSEETRSGNTTHADYSLFEYDSFCFEIEPDQERLINLVKNDIPDNSSNDPLLEEVDLYLSDNSIPPDKLNEDKCFEPGREINVSTKIEDDDYFPFMFVIRFFLPYFIFPEVSSLLLSAESGAQSLILDYPPEIEVILCRIFVRFLRSSYPLIDFSLGKFISF
nr:hypothetical protein [Tanacetum cinerariifolium]